MTSELVSTDLAGLIAPLRDQPHQTVGVMVTSVDGRATIAGRVGGLTGPADQQVLLGVRELAGALVVGGNTIRAEGYAELLDEDARARRRARGLPDEPELVPYTRSSPPLPELWAQLRERHPEGPLVCEGGPTLLGLVVAAGLLDQLVLCISPMLVGGDGKRIIESPEPFFSDRIPQTATPSLEKHQSGVALRPLGIATADGYLFVRYGAAR